MVLSGVGEMTADGHAARQAELLGTGIPGFTHIQKLGQFVTSVNQGRFHLVYHMIYEGTGQGFKGDRRKGTLLAFFSSSANGAETTWGANGIGCASAQTPCLGGRTYMIHLFGSASGPRLHNNNTNFESFRLVLKVRVPKATVSFPLPTSVSDGA